MAYIITIDDFKTHIYVENRDEISRGDDTIVTDCIEAAILEAAGFINGKYDVDKLLGTPTVDATVIDKNLKRKVLDIALFYLATLGTANIDYAATVEIYQMTIDNYFTKIQSNKLSPKNWPYIDKADIPEPPDGLEIEVNSNPKRNHRL